MNKHLSFINLMQILLIVMLALFALFGCKISEEKKEALHDIISYTPLTYEKYNGFINNTDTFCIVTIICRQLSDTGEQKAIILQAGRGNQNLTLGSIQVYDGDLDRRTINPIDDSYLRKQFAESEVQEIFNYLGNNNVYFFSGSEYQGHSQIQTTSRFFCREDYAFALIFYAPLNPLAAWSIQKCLDEYPAPDHPLYGLFQLLEEHFISQFE